MLLMCSFLAVVVAAGAEVVVLLVVVVGLFPLGKSDFCDGERMRKRDMEGEVN